MEGHRGVGGGMREDVISRFHRFCWLDGRP